MQYNNGSSAAPSGPAQLPSLLAGYAMRPPWEVAGVDYAVGIPSGTALKDPLSLSMPGVTVDATRHYIFVTGNNVTLSGYDFSREGGWGVYVEGANDTIANSNFKVGANNLVPIAGSSSAFNLSVLDDTIDGGGAGVAGNPSAIWSLISYNGTGLQVEAQLGSTLTNTEVENNTVIATGPSLAASYLIAIHQDAGANIANSVNLQDYLDPGEACAPIYPTPTGSNLAFIGNVSMVTGKVIAPPTGQSGTNVQQVTATPASGTETPGDTIVPTLHLDETAVVSGIPTLSLNTGGIATYSGGTDTNALSFVRDPAGNHENTAGAVVSLQGLGVGAARSKGPITDSALVPENAAGYSDGASGAPAGAPQRPNILNGYATRPPWEVAGVDYAVGVPAGMSLLDPTIAANLPAGVSMDAANHMVHIHGNNVTLNGYDFSLHGGWGVVIDAGTTGTTTIENCNFSMLADEPVAIDAQSTNVGNLIVKDCTFNGNKKNIPSVQPPPDGSGVSGAIVYNGSGTFVAEYNFIYHMPGDGIEFSDGSVTPTIEYNLFSGLGFTSGAHPDPVQFYADTVTNATIAFNTIYSPQGTAVNEGLAIESQGGASLTDTTIANNVIIATGPSLSESINIGVFQDPGNTTNGVFVKDNYLDPTGSWGPFGSGGSTIEGSNLVFSGNVDMVNGQTVQPTEGVFKASDVLSASASPKSGTEFPGNTVMIILHLDQPMIVAGTPELTLNDGGIASYRSGSGTSALTFVYTVGNADQAVAALGVTGVSLAGGARVKDANGNPANLSGALVTFSGLAIDPSSSSTPPIANPDTALTPEDRAATIAVLAVDSDADGTINPASVTVSAAPSHGTTSVNATTGAITYMPAAGFYGTDTFAYTVANTVGQISAPGTVTVTVDAPPTTVPDAASTTENQPVTIAVLAKDSDVDGTINPASVAVGTGPAHGSASINTTTGAITYMPAAGFTGTDTFTYTVADTLGVVSAPATVTVTVSPPGGTGYQDGSSAAPAGAAQLPSLLNGYAARPPWKVAGVDYAVGVPAGTALKDPATISMPGVSVNTGNHTVSVTGNNITLNGYDFGLAGGWAVIAYPNATNTTIENSHFRVGSNGQVPVQAGAGVGDLTLLYDTFDGASSTNSSVWTMVNYNGSGTFTSEYNSFVNAPADAIDFSANKLTSIVKYNLFDNLGTLPGSHPDSVQNVANISNNSVFEFNTVYQPNPSGMQGIQLAAYGNSTLTNTSIENNVVLAKGPGIEMSYSIALGQAAGGSNFLNGALVQDNYIDFTGAYGPFYPPGGSNLAFVNNVNISSGATLAAPSGTSASNVQQVLASPSSGTEMPGATVVLTLHLNEIVTVSGTPGLNLNTGGLATYSGGSGTSILTFSYTVANTDTTVPTLAITGLNLANGASIRDPLGNEANLSGALVAFSGLGVDPPSGDAAGTQGAFESHGPDGASVLTASRLSKTDVPGTLAAIADAAANSATDLLPPTSGHLAHRTNGSAIASSAFAGAALAHAPNHIPTILPAT